MNVILDNIIFSLQKSGGISVYWYELVKRILTNKNPQSILKPDLLEPELINPEIFENSNAHLNLFAQQLQLQLNYKTIQESRVPLFLLRYLDFTKLTANKSEQALPIFHSSYYRHAPGKINIVTVHDFTYEFYRKGLAKKLHHWQKSRAITKASGIICISESTKKDLLHFYPNLKTPICIINQGKSENFCVLDKEHKYSSTVQFLVKLKFYLFIGDRRNYKNFEKLLDQLEQRQVLVIVGGGELTVDEKNKLKQKLNNYYHFVRPKNSLLNELYNLAYALLYPSAYEGFGIPVIEAMATGCPVVCQKISSLTEVAGNAGVFFQLSIKGDLSGSLQHSLTLLDDKKFYQQMVVRGIENAHLYSWDKCYQQTIDFYSLCLAQHVTN